MNSDLKILSWNVRGLRGKVKRVQEEVRRINASLCVLCETRLREKNVSMIMNKGWNRWSWVSNHQDHPGGRLIVLWNPDVVEITVMSSSAQFIHLMAEFESCCVFITAVYGLNDPSGRMSLWRDLCCLGGNINGPWIVLGDFNAIRNIDERRGEVVSSYDNDIDEFNCCLAEAGLLEAEYKGSWFTWDNHQLGRNLILSKIDRVFLNQSIVDMMDSTWVDVISNSISDHRILCLHLDIVVHAKRIPFRHFNAWVSLNNYKSVVEDAWRVVVEGCPMYQVVQKLKNVRRALIRWNKMENGDLFAKAKDLRTIADVAQAEFDRNPFDTSLQMMVVESRKKAEVELTVESYLRQKSRCIWLREGDRNSKFFYLSMKSRRNRNSIRCVEEGDSRITSKLEIEAHITDFYTKLYNQNKASSQHWDFDSYIPKLTDEDLASLCKEVTVDEIEKVIEDVNPDKAPGPDGYNGFFFKHNWSIIKADVIKAVLTFFQSGRMLREANRTYITLILKVEDSKNVRDFRPISLCNFIYKIISKVLVRRLRNILPKLISNNQFAFLKGRGLLEAVLLANEVIGELKAQDLIALKVDITKAYDSLQWNYLISMMRKMGFPNCWINWIHVCLESASFQILINGEPGKMFHASNGVRQGDPLAPYLFLIGMEGLSCMLKKAMDGGLISPACAGDTKISHILYADDIMVFGKNDVTEALAIKKIFERFELISGLRMNPMKSQLIMGRSSNRVCLQQCLGINLVDLPSSYLGLPLFSG